MERARPRGGDAGANLLPLLPVERARPSTLLLSRALVFLMSMGAGVGEGAGAGVTRGMRSHRLSAAATGKWGGLAEVEVEGEGLLHLWVRTAALICSRPLPETATGMTEVNAVRCCHRHLPQDMAVLVSGRCPTQGVVVAVVGTIPVALDRRGVAGVLGALHPTRSRRRTTIVLRMTRGGDPMNGQAVTTCAMIAACLRGLPFEGTRRDAGLLRADRRLRSSRRLRTRTSGSETLWGRSYIKFFIHSAPPPTSSSKLASASEKLRVMAGFSKAR